MARSPGTGSSSRRRCRCVARPLGRPRRLRRPRRAGWPSTAATASPPTARLGEYQTLSRRRARRRGADRGRGVAGRLRRSCRASRAYGAREARRWAEQAAEAGAPVRDAAAARTPTGPTRRRSSSTTARSRRSGCRRRLQQPVRHEGRPDARRSWRGCTREGLIVAVKEFTGRRRGAPTRSPSSLPGSTSSSAPTTWRSRWRSPGAVGWVAGYPNALPRACRRLCNAASSRATSRPRCRSTAHLHPLLRWDSQDRVRPGDQAVDGPRRPLRRSVPPAARRRCPPEHRRGTIRAAHREGARRRAMALMRARRVSSTPSTRTPRACRPA